MRDDGERRAWVALAGVSGMGPARFGSLVGAAGGARAVLELAACGEWTRLDAQERVAPALRTAIQGLARAVPDVPEDVVRHGVWTLTPLDEGYPDAFAVLPDPPPVLYGWGDPATLGEGRRVTVVGTRRPSIAGRALAGAIARQLVELRVAVVSGLAFGIDGAAHAATVAAGGVTVGVIGAGHGQPGPRAHRDLVGAILASGGAVVSELPPRTAPSRTTFPRRNRLLSALGAAVIVVEAPLRSGAVSTAHHALEHGHPLFVVPGRPGDRLTAGCLRLLRETEARPLVGLDELVADLASLGILAGSGTGVARGSRATGPTLSRRAALGLLGPAERAVAEVLSRGPAGLDRLIETTGLAPATAAGAVTVLQLRGWVTGMGATFVAAGPLARPR
ncbi:MAG: DNA-processing protein DprA [Candidatus Limnocylindrales bacterium]